MDLFMTLALKQSVFISAQMLRFDKYFKAIQQKRGSSHLGNMSTDYSIHKKSAVN